MTKTTAQAVSELLRAAAGKLDESVGVVLYAQYPEIDPEKD